MTLVIPKSCVYDWKLFDDTKLLMARKKVLQHKLAMSVGEMCVSLGNPEEASEPFLHDLVKNCSVRKKILPQRRRTYFFDQKDQSFNKAKMPAERCKLLSFSLAATFHLFSMEALFSSSLPFGNDALSAQDFSLHKRRCLMNINNEIQTLKVSRIFNNHIF